VRIDLADVGCGEPGVVQREFHALDGAGAAGRGRGDVVRVGVAGRAHHLSDDVGAAGNRRFPLLEHQRGRSLAEHETVALGGEGATDARAGERGHVAERCHGDRARSTLATTRDTGIDHAPCDQTSRIADGVRARSAGGGDRLIRALQAIAHGNGCSGGIGHHHGDEEWRDAPLALLDENPDLLLRRTQSTDAGGEDGAEAAGVGSRPTSVLEALRCRCDSELLDLVGTTRFLQIRVVRRRIPIGDLDRATGGDARAVEAVPERLLPDTAGSNHAVAGDGNTPTAVAQGRGGHQSLPTTRS